MTENPYPDSSGNTPYAVVEASGDDSAWARAAFGFKQIWLGLLIIAGLLFTAASSVVLASAHPDSCGWCHGDVEESALSSSHPEVRCESCHADDSRVGVLMLRVSVVDMAVGELIPRAGVAKAVDVSTERCLICHRDQMNETVVVSGIKMNHAAPLSAGWSCQSCHPGAGHAASAASSGYTMDMCLGCHSANPGNLSTCETCHAEEASSSAKKGSKSPWQITHGPNWKTAHGMGDQSTCGGCHVDGYCTRCHGANVPHKANYLAKHGQDVLGRVDGPSACYTCHRETACMDCHGVEMPHPVGFANGHAEAIRAGEYDEEKSCLRCHKPASCESCHEEHTHPGLSAERRRALSGRPVEVR